jgi:hypothetical protein
MASSFIVINAPKTTTLANPTGLSATIAAAQPGEVIVVEEAGSPITLNLSSQVKSGYGVCVQLPMGQVIELNASGGTSNIHFFGGTFSSDIASGDTALGNNGLNISPGCSKISVHGAFFDRNHNSIVCNTASDIWIRQTRLNASRADHAQTPTTSRMTIEETNFDSGARGQSICYFNDGRSPQHSISSASCSSQGGTWEDTAHADLWQFRTGCSDIIALNNNCAAFGMAGMVYFGTLGPEPLTRCLIAGNTISDAYSHGINVQGQDCEVRDNVVNGNVEMSIQPAITLSRSPGDARVRGGRNEAPSYNNPSGVTLQGTDITGDTVNPPERPRITLPAWAPVPVMPDPLPLAAPEWIAGGGIRPGGTLTVGTWATLNRGQWLGTEGITWEYRWTRNGTPIGGEESQVYQIVSDDVGQNLNVEVRGTNSAGTGEWYSYTNRVPE